MIYKPNQPERKVIDGTTIQVGLPLVDRYGNFIGKVKEIQEQGFVVDRSPQHFEDLFVPYWVCMNDRAEQIWVDIAEYEVNKKEWRTPKNNKED